MARINNEIYIKFSILDESIVNTKDTLLIVVDMINGFVVEGNMADPMIKDIIPAQRQLIEKLSLAKKLFFIDAHDEDCQEFECFLKHCVKGTKESEVVEELLEDMRHAWVIEKNSTNGFLAPDFQSQLEQILSYKNFVIVGCCTDICVMQFALTLQTYIHQHDLDIKVFVVVDGVDSYHIEGIHDVYEYNDMSIRLMQAAGIQCVRIGEV